MFSFLDGYKTYIAGVGMILVALVTVAHLLLGVDVGGLADGATWQTAFAEFTGGLAALGLRHAIAKTA